MKTLGVPISGKCGQSIASRNHFGPISASWGTGLTKDQYVGWRRLAARTPSRVRLGKAHSLTGQTCYVAVNSVLARLVASRQRECSYLFAPGSN